MDIQELKEFVNSLEELQQDLEFYKARCENLLNERKAIIKAVQREDFQGLVNYFKQES